MLPKIYYIGTSTSLITRAWTTGWMHSVLKLLKLEYFPRVGHKKGLTMADNSSSASGSLCLSWNPDCSAVCTLGMLIYVKIIRYIFFYCFSSIFLLYRISTIRTAVFDKVENMNQGNGIYTNLMSQCEPTPQCCCRGWWAARSPSEPIRTGNWTPMLALLSEAKNSNCK